MTEGIIKKKQIRRYMVYNLLAFTIIFGLFGSIIYAYMRNTLFSGVEEDIKKAQELIEEYAGFVDFQQNFQFGDKPQLPLKLYNGEPNAQMKEAIRIQAVPMRMFVLIRDMDGNVLNERMMGRIYWEDALDQIPYSLEQSDHITSFRLADGSRYHGAVFPVSDSRRQSYIIQVFANVDGEQRLLDNFLRIIIVCGLVFLTLSANASYILSRMNMTPLLRSWRRQAEFVANASHELRTPLTVIQTKLEDMLTAPKSTILDKADDVVVSLSETRRLTKLTSDLMTLARADSDAVQLTKERFFLRELVESVSEPYREFAEMQNKKLSLVLEDTEQIYADRGRLHELMIILLDNALKYTREGDFIEVRTFQKENKTVLQVRDTGIGIGEESITRIFDRFYRGDKARSRENGGTGLGLSIAQWIVNTHGGSIRAYANNPHGAAFEVRLPK